MIKKNTNPKPNDEQEKKWNNFIGHDVQFFYFLPSIQSKTIHSFSNWNLSFPFLCISGTLVLQPFGWCLISIKFVSLLYRTKISQNLSKNQKISNSGNQAPEPRETVAHRWKQLGATCEKTLGIEGRERPWGKLTSWYRPGVPKEVEGIEGNNGPLWWKGRDCT